MFLINPRIRAFLDISLGNMKWIIYEIIYSRLLLARAALRKPIRRGIMYTCRIRVPRTQYGATCRQKVTNAVQNTPASLNRRPLFDSSFECFYLLSRLFKGHTSRGGGFRRYTFAVPSFIRSFVRPFVRSLARSLIHSFTSEPEHADRRGVV